MSFQIAVWNSYRGMNLTEKSNRDKNNNVTDSLANRTLIVTTILVRRKVKQRTALGKGGGYMWEQESTDTGTREENTTRGKTVGRIGVQKRKIVAKMNSLHSFNL